MVNESVLSAFSHFDERQRVLQMKAVCADMATAFACGHHSRLGSSSPVSLMDKATVQSDFELFFWRH
eukprot:m51a1_g2215 hypothetical protein (67) ;mRNA; f:209566-209766